ncbi:unnamed protein product [Prorocentrum cordatum]|uniref:F-actin-capping protein subunit alpha n=1 Tax=Prorocentrum cordatum TaxID=2364126 RepID=A0ABN9SUN6_9DINO|nr:unnamed protein product [Polarella glacialis]
MGTLRTAVLRSMVARAGQIACTTTTRSISMVMSPSPWATTISPAQQLERSPKSSTHLATNAAMTVRFKSKVEYTFGYQRCDDGKVRIFLHHSSVPYAVSSKTADPKANMVASTAAVTREDVIAVQNAWAGAIKNISKIYKENGDYVQAAATAAGELYAYGKYDVLFKPTKAAQHQFRPKAEEAMSYFVGCKAVDNGYAEDGGFAINGGKGWSDCVYDNHQVAVKSSIAIAMGNYYFTCATTGEKSKVEYTFGYKRCEDGKVRIFLHHSSVPYMAVQAKAPAAELDVTLIGA